MTDETPHDPVTDRRVANSAKNRVCIDFDMTLMDWVDLDSIPKPLPFSVKAVEQLQQWGYTVFILTSRYSPTWWEDHCRGTDLDPREFGAFQKSIVARALVRAGIHNVVATCEKVPALVYIDDRAISFTGDWASILETLKR